MNNYRVYAVDADDPAHRVFMYSIPNKDKWLRFKYDFGLKPLLDKDDLFVDMWCGVWFVKEFKEDEDGQ